ncbi:MAG: putative arabinose efflux permease, family [Actinomycetia bacterium]|nr:putative arabinose efflux permease, family [Actinomycetes bacterium]
MQIGAVVTGTLVGSAVLTLAVGLRAGRAPRRTLLLASAVLMAVTGAGFASVRAFWPLLIVAVVGTLNPSAGDVSVFLPAEQALLADEATAAARPRLYARYNLAGTLAGAFGALASGLPGNTRVGFVLYGFAALVVGVLYRGLDRVAPPPRAEGPRRALRTSRRTVLELAALFSLDAAGGGFAVTSLLVLWLHLRFGLSPGTTGALFFGTGLLGAASQLLAGRLADRFGLVRTMVFTHLPAGALLALVALAPTSGVAMALLLLRSLLAQMDVPARQAFVMAVVPPEERAAAASVTNVPRSLASATTPLLAGILLTHSHFGWPLVIAGITKMAYDLLLLRLYSGMVVEEGAVRTPSGSRRSGSRRSGPSR